MGFLGDMFSTIGSVASMIPGIGSIGGAVASGIGSALGSQLNQDESQAYQKEMMLQNQHWQSAENEKNRQWQSDEWMRQFNASNEYNTPENQAKRLAAAGINPAVAFGSSGTGTSALSNASPSAPSGGTSFSPSPDYSSVLTRGFVSQESLFNRLKMMNEIKRGGIENEFIGQKMEAEINQIIADISNTEAQTKVTNFNQKLNEMFGISHRSKELQKLKADTVRSYADAFLASQQGSEVDASIFEKHSNALLNYAKKHLTDKQVQQLELALPFVVSDIKSQINLRNSQSNEANQRAETERQLRASRVDLAGLEADLARNRLRFSDDTLYKRIELVNQSLLNSKNINEQQKETLKRMSHITSWQEFDRYFNYVTRLLDLALPNPTSGVPTNGFPELYSPATPSPSASPSLYAPY